MVFLVMTDVGSPKGKKALTTADSVEFWREGGLMKKTVSACIPLTSGENVHKFTFNCREFFGEALGKFLSENPSLRVTSIVAGYDWFDLTPRGYSVTFETK